MATTKSTQMTAIDAVTTADKLNASAHAGNLHIIAVDYTVAGAAIANADIVELCTLPPGARLHMGLCYYEFSATQGASTTVDVGWQAYKGADGTTTAADPDGICDAAIATVTTPTVWALGTYGTGIGDDKSILFTSQEPVTIQMTANDAGGTYDGDIADVMRFTFVYSMS